MSTQDQTNGGQTRSTMDGSKSRHSSTSDTSHTQSPAHLTSQNNSFFSHSCRLMFTRFPYRDKSYIAGVLFTCGSAFVIVNGFFTSLALMAPDAHQITLRYSGPILNIIGTLLLCIGSSFAVFEAFNGLENEIILMRDFSVELSTNTLPKNVEASVQTADRSCTADTSSSGQLYRHVLQTQEGDGATRSNDTQTRSRLMAFLRYPFEYSSVIFLRVATLEMGGTLFMAIAAILSFPFTLSPTTNGDRICIKFLFPTLGGTLLLLSSLLRILSYKLNSPAHPPPSFQIQVAISKSVGSVGFFLAGLLPWIAACTSSGGCPGGPGDYKGDNGEKSWGEFWGSIAVCCGGLAFMIGGSEQWSGALEKYR